ncbi:protein of unknown function [Pseudonocardia ammonioxydans]|uniref:DUF1707 domain-containing protein n=1 Tax=Pseudonocardia ammonioxydans TaxID=260086 RepID=A0A1I5EWM2_PSUAM|nr:DUF1707 domain-containing protein [Pseudonocardia ammonioxydans]SFO15819.1 protein of unknown function [Pseudonocardia ammonioxydans]
MGEPQESDGGAALMRVSDTERQETAERLKLAHDQGRLSLTEYDQRLRDAYAATVRRDLDVLTADLPAVRRSELPTVQAEAAEVEKTEAKREYLKEWRSWAGTAVLLTGIWLVTAVASGGLPFFWPIFPIGIWGAVLLAQLFWGDDE